MAVAHAGGVRSEQLDAVKLPIFFLQAETDPLWKPETLEKAKQVCWMTRLNSAAFAAHRAMAAMVDKARQLVA